MNLFDLFKSDVPEVMKKIERKGNQTGYLFMIIIIDFLKVVYDIFGKIYFAENVINFFPEKCYFNFIFKKNIGIIKNSKE